MARNDTPCGVLAFTRGAMKQYKMKFRDTDTHGEEKYFLRDFRVPILHCDPQKTIVAVQHGKNTWNVQFNEKTRMDYSLPDEVLKMITLFSE
jgi:hypothetical protein